MGIAGAYYLHNETVRVPGAPGEAGTPVDSTRQPSCEWRRGSSSASCCRGRGTNIGLGLAGARGLERDRFHELHWTFLPYPRSTAECQLPVPDPRRHRRRCGQSERYLPCAINNYNNLQPSYYTFDLSIGYDTGDRPANEYLRNISIQLTVDNLMDRHPAPSIASLPAAVIRRPSTSRKISMAESLGVRLQKTW